MKRILILALLFFCGCAGGPVTPPALQITTTSLPQAVLNAPYSQQLAAVGGVAPYVWSVASGTLPKGIALEQNGLLHGTPLESGEFQFTVEVSDSALGEVRLKIKWRNA
jgi:hypothetical protein